MLKDPLYNEAITTNRLSVNLAVHIDELETSSQDVLKKVSITTRQQLGGVLYPLVVTGGTDKDGVKLVAAMDVRYAHQSTDETIKEIYSSHQYTDARASKYPYTRYPLWYILVGQRDAAGLEALERAKRRVSASPYVHGVMGCIIDDQGILNLHDADADIKKMLDPCKPGILIPALNKN